ncbi:MAG: magnesium/cobalt transporter CorA [Anaeromyxobacter sp.]|nr:magnesium/cobalt transporter CorA [Anaeromyxobacter sp.]MBL0274896.1 magnesium/cobalt transporter CorA [Anaeromyxobacter sp.]
MLINCVAYQEGRKLGDIHPADIGAHVARPECFVWVALEAPTAAEIDQMEREFHLHQLAVEDARHGHQRPKLEEYGDSLFVVLHTVELDGGELHTGEVDVFAAGNYVLSLRSRTRQGFADVRARCEREPALLGKGSGFVLYALIDAVVDRYFPVVDALEEELERVEQRIFGGAPARETVEALYGLKQKLNLLQHAVRPLLEAVGKLLGGRVPQVCAGLQDYYRDVYDHLLRITQSIEGLRDMATTAISVNLSLISMQENETTKRLAAYGALVAVPTLIAGLYGMNFQNMPELSWAFGYPAVLGGMAIIDLLIFVRLRRAGWL